MNKLMFLLSLVHLALPAFSQKCFDVCDENDKYPTQFKGQICWLLNELCYDFRFPRWGAPKKASNDDVQRYLNYTTGNTSFYYPQQDIPWGSNWFPCRMGGIARRWGQADITTPGSLYPTLGSLLQWGNLKNMTQNQLNTLSPSEKLDIFIGNRDFKITKWELTHRGPYRPNTSDDNFCGFCNGARSSGALTREPLINRTVQAGAGAKMINPNSNITADPAVTVTFYPTDIKALAAASFYYNERAYNIGRNNTKNMVADPNPAILDFMLRFLLTQMRTPFFLDVMPNEEIWNETILGYERTIQSVDDPTQSERNEIAIPSIHKVVTIDVKLYCQDEVDVSEINTDTKSIMADKQKALQKNWVKERHYKYKLYVDNTNKILDGKWIVTPGWETRVYNTNDATPIDFIWMATGGGADHQHGGNVNINYRIIKYLFNGADLNEQSAVATDSRRQSNPYLEDIPQPFISEENRKKLINQSVIQP